MSRDTQRAIPSPVSGGLILSYKCTAECRHCIYACSTKWSGDWITEEDLESTLSQLAGRINPSPFGPKTVSLNHGLHFSGGEPFVNFELLLRAVEIASELKIPSTFVETNCFWCKDDKSTKEKLKLLKRKGLKGIMISVNPFYLEYVSLERTERAIMKSLDVFGKNTMVYQLEYYRRFKQWGFSNKVQFENYLKHESKADLARNVEFFAMGRAPYKLKEFLKEFIPLRKADSFFDESCMGGFLRSVHNHFDNYGNYVPGFCGGITLGDSRRLDDLTRTGTCIEHYPVLGFLIDNDMEGLLRFAMELGYKEQEEGYFSKCHLCTDIRRHLIRQGDFRELKPREFYDHLECHPE
jgi:hypothetical protein